MYFHVHNIALHALYHVFFYFKKWVTISYWEFLDYKNWFIEPLYNIVDWASEEHINCSIAFYLAGILKQKFHFFKDLWQKGWKHENVFYKFCGWRARIVRSEIIKLKNIFRRLCKVWKLVNLLDFLSQI